MRKALAILVLLAPLSRGQGEEPLVDRILSGKLSPRDRIALVDQVLRSDAGADALARRALDPSLDAEVLHAVVDGFLASGRYPRYLHRICLLLLDGQPALAEKVRTRIQRVAEDPAGAPALRQRLRELVEGRTPEASGNARIRQAAVRALTALPHREAIEVAVGAWAGDADESVRREAREAMQDVLPSQDPAAAGEYIRTRPAWSYHDFVRELSRARRTESEKLRKVYTATLTEVLRAAGSERAFQTLAGDDPYGREVAAARLKELAAQNRMEDIGREEFARRTVEAFDRLVGQGRQEGQDPTLVHLMDTLGLLAQDGSDAPLFKTTKPGHLLGTLDFVPTVASDSSEVGLAAVRLLALLGDESFPLLGRLAQEHHVPAVRQRAVQALAAHARENEVKKDAVGRRLTELLLAEKDAGVRNVILQMLRDAVVEAAFEPARMILLPDPGNAQEVALGAGLSPLAAEHALAILRQIGTPKSLEAIVKVAQSHPRHEVRLSAAAVLLQRTPGSPEEEAAAWEIVRGLVLSEAQPPAVRAGAIDAIAARGTRRSADTLLSLHGLNLPADLHAALGAAEFALAERLGSASNGSAAPPEDYAAAIGLLQRLSVSEAPEKVEALARKLIDAGSRGGRPVGPARLIWASSYEKEANADPAEVLRRYRLVVEKAADDGLEPRLETELLRTFRTLASKQGQDRTYGQLVVRCSVRLAELAGEDEATAGGYFLDAAEAALRFLDDRDAAQQHLEAAERAGAATGALAGRLLDLRKALEAAPKPETPNG